MCVSGFSNLGAKRSICTLRSVIYERKLNCYRLATNISSYFYCCQEKPWQQQKYLLIQVTSTAMPLLTLICQRYTQHLCLLCSRLNCLFYEKLTQLAGLTHTTICGIIPCWMTFSVGYLCLCPHSLLRFELVRMAFFFCVWNQLLYTSSVQQM